MLESERDYHTRRAAMQRFLAERCANPAAATAHHALAELHDQRAMAVKRDRPVLRMVV